MRNHARPPRTCITRARNVLAVPPVYARRADAPTLRTCTRNTHPPPRIHKAWPIVRIAHPHTAPLVRRLQSRSPTHANPVHAATHAPPSVLPTREQRTNSVFGRASQRHARVHPPSAPTAMSPTFAPPMLPMCRPDTTTRPHPRPTPYLHCPCAPTQPTAHARTTHARTKHHPYSPNCAAVRANHTRPGPQVCVALSPHQPRMHACPLTLPTHQCAMGLQHTSCVPRASQSPARSCVPWSIIPSATWIT